jgi:hypothetical protein
VGDRYPSCHSGVVQTLLDDLGHPLLLPEPPRRVVSLVPSLSEAIAVTCTQRLVGATDWCVEPADLDVRRVRGTKNPDHAAIAALAPDLVVANQEENRAVDVERLRASGIPVWVTVVESVADALRSLRRLLIGVLAVSAPDWLETAESEWRAAPPQPSATAVIPIWRDPWMVVGPRTYATDLLRHLGIANVFGDTGGEGGGNAPGGRDRNGRAGGGSDSVDRYPRTGMEDLLGRRPDMVVLPDEPYAFSADDGPEVFPGLPVALVSGRALTWYGPAMVTAAEQLRPAFEEALGHSLNPMPEEGAGGCTASLHPRLDG